MINSLKNSFAQMLLPGALLWLAGLNLLGFSVAGCGSVYSAPSDDGMGHSDLSIGLVSDGLGAALRMIGTVSGCRSGFSASFDTQNSDKISLLTGDQSCRVLIDTVEISGQSYVATDIHSETIFEASDGSKLIVIPSSPFPDPIPSTYFDMHYEVARLAEGRASTVVAKADDLISRSEMMAWFKNQGRFVIDRNGGVSQWRSEFGFKSRLVQNSKAARPRYRAGGGVDFTDSNASLSFDSALSKRKTNKAVSLLIDLSPIAEDGGSRRAVVSFGSSTTSGHLSIGMDDHRIVLMNGATDLVEIGEIERDERLSIVIELSSEGMKFYYKGSTSLCSEVICQNRALASFGALLDSRSRPVIPSFRGVLVQSALWMRPLEDFEIDLLLQGR